MNEVGGNFMEGTNIECTNLTETLFHSVRPIS